MRHLPVLFVATLLLFPLTASADWTALRSPNFTYIGDASEGQIRDVARRLEQFREVMLRALRNSDTESPVPTVVVVFRNTDSFKPFMPMQDGKLVEVGGYFQGARDINYIALNVELGEVSYPAIFHEYTHFLVRNNAGELPLWLNEGYAGVYESFEVRDGGKSALIGLVQARDLEILDQQTWLPLTDLNTITRESPIYNGDRRRGLFYAESWALTHYLMIGNKERTPQFQDYLSRIEKGEPSVTALPAAFGDLAVLQRELREYVRRWTFSAYRFNFGEKVMGAAVGAPEKVPEYEAQGYLGDLLGRVRGVDPGRAYLQRVLAAKADAARAAAALGVLEARESNFDTAIQLLAEAVAVAPGNAMYQAALGRTLFARLQGGRGGDTGSEAIRARAVEALTKAWELNPKVAEVAAMLGYLDEDLPRATMLMKQAIALEPSREDYRLMLANLLARNRDLEGATAQLGRLMARGSTAEIRDNARAMLTQVAEIRRVMNGETTPRVTTSAPPDSSALPTATASSTDVPPSAVMSAGAARPEMLHVEGTRMLIPLRPLGAGETRMLGTFTSVECRQGNAVLVVQTETGSKRLSVRSLAQVDFISYRENAPSAVNCGPQTPGRVYATYRASQTNGVDGEAVAIELLPDNAVIP